MKLLREPLLHFMFIGAVIYLLYSVFAEPLPEGDDKTIVVSAGEIEWMHAAWRKRWNRPPTPEEFDGLIQQYVRETVLARDLVALTPPTEEELQAYFDKHRDRYQEPVRYTFTQVFIDPDKRGDTTLDHAAAVKAKLVAQDDATGNPGTLGDDFMLQNYYPEKDSLEIQKLFGSGFTESLMELSAGKWHGPILSGYGTHLVYVHSINEPPATVFAEVQERVVQDWKAEKGAELNEQFYASLRDRYTIVVEEPAVTEKVATVPESGQ
jgi:hypothetical protein